MFHAHIFYLTFTFLWIGKPSFWEVQPQEDNESFDCSFLSGVCEGKIIPKLMISIALVADKNVGRLFRISAAAATALFIGTEYWQRNDHTLWSMTPCLFSILSNCKCWKIYLLPKFLNFKKCLILNESSRVANGEGNDNNFQILSLFCLPFYRPVTKQKWRVDKHLTPTHKYIWLGAAMR